MNRFGSYFFAFAIALLPWLSSSAFATCQVPQNAIEAENCLAGTPQSQWDISGAGDSTVQGFATDISFNRGQTVFFKINTDATSYKLDIYRMGYYSGMGARLVTTISPSVTLPQNQPACITNSTTALIDCGNWAVSALWTIPANATSGIYFAKVSRLDSGGASHIVFVVRNDSSTSDILFKTSDTTWQAYNDYGGANLYTGGPGAQGGAYKVSYNRPFHTRVYEFYSWVFNAEYPMVRFLEANGYDVSYFSSLDADRSGSLMLQHKGVLSVGHDEYWSGNERMNVEAARAAGIHLGFFSSNEIFWKTRWEPSIDGSNTANRTLVCYKETHANKVIDPQDPPTWTGTWRDPRFSPPADGGRPENALSGTIFMVNGPGPVTEIKVPAADGKMRFWRNTLNVASQTSGQTYTTNGNLLGFEWDIDADNGSRPAGLFDLSTATYNISGNFLLDFGSTYGNGTATHHATMYRFANAGNSALIFATGTSQWPWALDGNHDGGSTTPDVNLQQATINVLADMGLQPVTLQGGLIQASASIDTAPPNSTITSPASGSTLPAGTQVTISGTAADTGGGVVGGVEVSTDGGSTWHPSTGRGSWTYNWTPATSGAATIMSRAVDDSGNLETPSAGVNVTVATGSCPCSVWGSSTTPTRSDSGDPNAVELGVRFRADVNGFITGIRFYKASTNTGTHIGNLWTNTGTKLATATFSGESASGWQQVDFSPPVAITANTTYVASYFDPNGHYSATNNYFTTTIDNAPLHFLQDGLNGANGIYNYGSSSAFPNSTFQSTNYWVDVVFAPGNSNTPPTVTSVNPPNNSTGAGLGGPVSATFSEPLTPSSVNTTTFLLTGSSNNQITATVSYDSSTTTAALVPSVALTPLSTYTATLKGGSGGIKDFNGNAMVSDFTWSFTTGTVPPPPNPGPGGPILVISNAANPFTQYYSEILSTEGLNEFAVKDISSVTASTLANYDVAILGDMSLTSSQVSMLTTWVSGGGELIAMHPDKQLAGMLGLTPTSATLSNAYMLVNTSSGPGVGIVGQTMQFHGAADLYTLSGASSLANLYSSANTPTTSPAATLVNFGAGQAAAFTYDLARSVVYTRQGNPAWSGQARDGQSGPIRSDDLYFGAASFDPQPDWVNLTKVAIPQADEQQRLLANLILQMDLGNKPLPRFWYLPSGFKAAVVMTGDDHGSFYSGSATSNRFADFLAASPAGCSVTNWQCVRATSYLFPQSLATNPLTDSQAAAYAAQGFEISVHADSSPTCSNWSTSALDSFYASQMASFAGQFPSLPAPQTHRMHCIGWSDYDSQPQIELKHGIRLDTSYYYWPPSWINDQPGMFTGSGMPMRYTDRNGNLIDVYQAPTQMTDESGQSYPFNIDTLLGNAVGSTGYYGVFVANMHNDQGSYPGPGANAIVASAQANGVPIVSSLQMLQWLDGRNKSSFGSLAWNSGTLSFNITVGTGARNLQAMLPVSIPAGTLTSVTFNGAPVVFSNQTIKGVQYALFNANAGSYVATYGNAGPVPIASLSPTSVAFGNQLVNTSSAAQTVTLSNTGTAALTINGVSITGTNLGDFAQTNNCGGSVAAGSSCTISVTFTPAAAGSRSATLSVSDNAAGSPHTAALSGNGTNASVSLSPTTVAFGNQLVNTSSAAQTVTLSNTGTAAVTINSISITGTNSSDFTQTNNCGTSVAGAGSCTISVTFTPAAAGSRAATLSVSDNAAGSPHTAALSGNGTNASVSLSPTTLAFGNQVVNTSSAAQTVTLSNTGTAAVTINSISITGTNSGDFTQTNNCGTSVAGAGSCTISVTFTPAAAGSRSATLSVSDNVAGSPQTASLTGTGTAPVASVSPTTLAFGNQLVNTNSAARSVTLSNTGSAALTISSISITGTNSGDFTQTNNCGTSVAAAGSCTINVSFKPLATGSRSATLSVSDNAAGSPQTASLSGTGTVAVASVSPTTLTFGNQLVSTTSAAQSVTLSNTGNGVLTISGYSFTGANAGDFSQTHTCGSTLAAGANCTINVSFRPTATGSRTATLNVSDNAAGSPQTVALSGTGTAPVVSLSPTSLNFGNQPVNTTSAPQTVTLSNTGTAPLTISKLSISGANAFNFAQTNNCGTSIAVGAGCTISVTFTPNARHSRSATLNVTDNAAGSPQKVTLTGSGT